MSEKNENLKTNYDLWEIYFANQDVFQYVINKTGKWYINEGIDLIHDFMIDHLPTALNSYNPQKGSIKPWLYIVFLNYARRRLLEIKSYMRRTISIDDIDNLVDDQSYGNSILNKVQCKHTHYILQKIDKEYRNALLAFFGDGEEAGNIRAVAKKYNWSRHKANQNILKGIAMLSAQLEEPGVIEREELLVCKLLLVEGRTWSQISEKIGKTENQVRRLFKLSIAKFKQVLN